MRKVIFEQTGNIISIILLIASSLEIISNFKKQDYNFQISFGIFTFTLIIWLLLFIFARVIYSKFDKQYNIKKGEYSTADEREEIISYKASVGAYKVIVFSLLIFFIWTVLTALFPNVLLFKNINAYVMSILFFGFSIIIGFLTYLFVWIALYLK
ncbi:hypothetical protein [Staphylococcus chromogenes]|uniref:hypothetical protein n=1 Tax=Staphylococcus chromogenes TaxID=46126 RepID=UPI00188F610B|nr:hypothetical protein [Staphylococcus chromogenes]